MSRAAKTMSATEAAKVLLEHVVFTDLEERLGLDAASKFVDELAAIADRQHEVAP